jgi:hypothetical protein
MRKMTIKPKDEQQLQEWIEKLNAAQVWHEVQEENGEIRIELAEASAKRVLGIQPETPKLTAKNAWKPILVFGIPILFLVLIFMPGTEPPQKSPDEMSREELTDYFHDKFGIYSEWSIDYVAFLKNNYVKYPRTFKKEEVQIFPISVDSMSHVFVFSAENAFGVRSDHSITSVIDSSGNLMRVVSFQ